MTEQNKISSDVEATVGSEQVAMPSQGRRRFTKGALLATPAVMTLMSGRLASAASATCAQSRHLVGMVLGTNDKGDTFVINESGGIDKYDSDGKYIKTLDPNGDKATQLLANNPGVGSCLASFA